MRRPDQRGSITIEVLVAVLLAASALASVMSGMTSSLAGSSAAADTAAALSIAKSQIAVARASRLRPGREEGRHDDRFGWAREVSEAPLARRPNGGEEIDSNFKLYRVDLAVTWTTAGRPRQLTVRTLHGDMPPQPRGEPRRPGQESEADERDGPRQRNGSAMDALILRAGWDGPP